MPLLQPFKQAPFLQQFELLFQLLAALLLLGGGQAFFLQLLLYFLRLSGQSVLFIGTDPIKIDDLLELFPVSGVSFPQKLLLSFHLLQLPYFLVQLRLRRFQGLSLILQPLLQPEQLFLPLPGFSYRCRYSGNRLFQLEPDPLPLILKKPDPVGEQSPSVGINLLLNRSVFFSLFRLGLKGFHLKPQFADQILHPDHVFPGFIQPSLGFLFPQLVF